MCRHSDWQLCTTVHTGRDHEVLKGRNKKVFYKLESAQWGSRRQTDLEEIRRRMVSYKLIKLLGPWWTKGWLRRGSEFSRGLMAQSTRASSKTIKWQARVAWPKQMETHTRASGKTEWPTDLALSSTHKAPPTKENGWMICSTVTAAKRGIRAK